MNAQHSTGTALRIQGLSLAYQDRPVLDDFSLTVNRGERVVLTGRSGAGKSTLLRCILGFDRPRGGSIWIFDRELDGETVWPLRQKVGYVQQEADPGEGRVLELLKRPFHYQANRERQFPEKRVRDLFRRFRLSADTLQKEIPDLSGGEKQRVALVAALILDRPLYLLDEITSALDPGSKKAVLEYLGDFQGTIVAVAHDREFARVAHRSVRIPFIRRKD